MKSDINRNLIRELIPNNNEESSKEVWRLLREENLSARLLTPDQAMILVFPSGTNVALHDLEKRSDLNGKIGVVKNHDLRRNRLGVTVGDTTVSICHSKCTPTQKNEY